MDSYEELLDMALSKVPKKTESDERFVIPKCDILPTGARTTIINFMDIVSTLRRDENHFLKFLLKELATSGDRQGKSLIVLGKFPPSHINRKIESYVKEYVLCEECGKPDTKIVKEDRIQFLKCEACGARHPISGV